jgi:hypothetical protein
MAFWNVGILPQQHNPEDLNLKRHHCESLKTHNTIFDKLFLYKNDILNQKRLVTCDKSEEESQHTTRKRSARLAAKSSEWQGEERAD